MIPGPVRSVGDFLCLQIMSYRRFFLPVFSFYSSLFPFFGSFAFRIDYSPEYNLP